MIMCEIIGRKKEIAELKRYYESGRAEFVAVYEIGRASCRERVLTSV